jgi:cysteinyl-tRNA synthetase
MALRIFNTLTRRKEDFVPLVAGEVRIYVCGVTVYDLSHIGHARSAIVFDVIRRYLRFKGLRVTFVKNYTDVDDRIIRKANEEGVAATVISERYIAEYQTDMASIGVDPADVEPKATEHIPQMVALIGRLIARGVAYELEGDVYFEVRRFPQYGKLSGKNLDELESGARVDVDERKRDPLDFALWKASKPGEPSWPSPWGPGRPGWHIECSAMSMQYLGETFDLHGGGEDLIFPHHENEIAQSEGATGKLFVRCWAHNGFVNLNAEKMSKSLGNTLWIKDMVRRHDPEALRLYFLGTHYRHPQEFGDERIEESLKALNRLRGLVAEADRIAAKGTPAPGPDGGLFDEVAAHRTRFEAAMDDDFNTPQALGVLFDLARLLQGARTRADEGDVAVGAFLLGVGELVTLARSLGLLLPGGRPARSVDPQLKAKIESLLYLREEARKQRDFAEADRLRGELTKLGVTLKDSRSGGTTWTLGGTLES